MNALIEAVTHVASAEPDVDFDLIHAMLEQTKERFIDERVKGFTHPETGQPIPPVSREEAEQRWRAAMPKYSRLFLQRRNDPDVNRKYNSGDKPGGSFQGQPTRLSRSVYTGDRQESLVARVIGHMLDE